MKLYAVRGARNDGAEWYPTNTLFISQGYSVTMLESQNGCWTPCTRFYETFCYQGFVDLTGQEVKPGEYIEIELEVL